MDKNTFFEYKESQAHSGYRSAVLYKATGATKYQFLCASETAPFPIGSKETFEFNLLNSATTGSVEGKDSAEQKEVELLYTRNNAMLFEKLKGQTLDFMTLTPQLVGYKYNGTISFKPNDATNDIHRGTYTITPMSIDTTPHYMAREEVLMPLFFANSIADEISVASYGQTDKIKINVTLNKTLTGVVYKYTTMTASTKQESEATTITENNGIIELTKPSVATMYTIYAEPSNTDAENYSGCFTTVYVTV